MFDWIVNTFAAMQLKLFEALVQPLMLVMGQSGVLEVGFEGTGWLLIGILQIIVIACIFVPLQRIVPVQPVLDRATIRTDILYTAIHRLGLFRVALFFAVDPLFDEFFGALRQRGISGIHLDQWLGISDNALLSLLAYVVVLDFIGYWIHRGQHQFNWWWKLHSMHHAQQQMTVWSDNRNHLLDDLLVDSLMVLAAQLIGVAPGQFMAFTAVTQLSESFQHGNLKIWFGGVGERLWVSPRFHRLHHAIGIGHETITATRAPLGGSAAHAVASVGATSDDRPPLGARAPLGGSAAHAVASVGATTRAAGPPQGARAPLGGSAAHAVASVGAIPILGGHNFGVLLPWWDALFKTANFEKRFDATGVRDQVEQGRNYGHGFWQQQWRGLLRLAGRA